LIAYREGVRSHLAVVDSEFGLRLEIDQHWQGDQDSSHLLMAAHMPALLHRDPQTVLVVGLGPGRTASRFLMHDIKRLDCVEIERELLDVVRRYFDSSWMDDPRVSFIIEDGRNYLTYTDATYDLISIEVGQVFRPGAASFYSREFYLRARDRLNPGGVISQFVPLHFFDVDEFRTVTATFLSVFPDSILWYNTYELLLIGGVDHQPVLSENRLAQIEANKNLHDDLEFSYWNGPDHHLNRQPVLLASFLAGPDGLAKMVGDAEIYEDDRPFLEYSTVRQRFGQQSLDYIEDFVRRQTDHADLIRGHVDPVQMVVERRLSPDEIEAVHKTRLQNIGAIGARGHLTAADFFRFRNEMDQAIEHYRAALQRLPEHAEANSFLARYYHGNGKLASAIWCYRRSLATKPDQSNIWAALGAVYELQGEHQEALRFYRRAIELEPALEEQIQPARLEGN
jgi:spermidine synthase